MSYLAKCILQQIHVLLAMILLLFFLAGCSTLKNGRRWGQDAIYPVSLERIRRAAHDAFFDWKTLVPAAGALIFAIDDFDERASDWAIDHTPIFGSIEDAKDWSDDLRTVLQVETLITAFATPGGDMSKDWAFSKLKGLTVELVARGITHSTTGFLKDWVDRTRPDGKDGGFPSAHASDAFSYATLSNRNLDVIPMSGKVRLPLKIGNFCLATGVAWARVEGKRHYPSDVLAGAALGHFISAFIHDAFIGLSEDDDVDLAILPHTEGAMVKVSFIF